MKQRAGPLRACLGPGGTTLTHGAPYRLPHPEGSRGPSDTAGPGIAYPSYPRPSTALAARPEGPKFEALTADAWGSWAVGS